MNINETLRNSIEEEISSETEKFKSWLENIPEVPDLRIPPEADVGIGTWAGDYDLRFPLDFDLIAEHKEMMLKAGWRIVHDSANKEEMADGSSGKVIYRNETRERLEISYSLWRDGATCERVVVETHTEETEVSTYEIVCKEGIEEDATKEEVEEDD